MHKMMTTQTPGARGPRVRFGTGLKKCGSPKPGAAALYRISSVRAAAPPPVFLKENRLTIWGPGEPRGRFCPLLPPGTNSNTPCKNGSGLPTTSFLGVEKTGSNAVEIIRSLPRPSQMLPHLPEANRVGTGKEAPRVTPLDPPGILIFRAILGHHNGRPQCPPV